MHREHERAPQRSNSLPGKFLQQQLLQLHLAEAGREGWTRQGENNKEFPVIIMAYRQNLSQGGGSGALSMPSRQVRHVACRTAPPPSVISE